MRIVARVATTDGQPVSDVKVQVLTVGRPLADGVVRGGELALSVDKLPPVWALAFDEQPVLAFPVEAGDDFVDLGEIVTSPEGWPWPAFHAPDGRVFVSGNYSQGKSSNIASLYHPISPRQPWVNAQGVFRSSRYVDGNMFFDINPAVRLGLSYQWVSQKLADDTTVHNHRFETTLLYFL